MFTKKYEIMCDRCEKARYCPGNKRQASKEAVANGWYMNAGNRSNLQFCSDGCRQK
jgi:hypothetical protein